MPKQFEIEICVSSLEMALEAEKGGADRIELCAALSEGGLTPQLSLMEQCKERLSIETMVMIRPRSGDFLYTDIEFDSMKRDVLHAKKLGVAGIVFGILKADGSIDMERSREIIELAHPLKTCFHRAIDMSNDFSKAFQDLLELGVDRVLSSGGENKAVDGLKNLAMMEKESKGRIEVMVGSGVNAENAREIYEKTGIRHYHLSAKTEKESLMTYKNPRVSMGGNPAIPEYGKLFTDSERVSAMLRKLGVLN